MTRRAAQLAGRLQTFIDEVTGFVAGCSETDWDKVCPWEDWTVGVTARHIGAGHLEALSLVRMIVDRAELPGLTREQVTAMANDHARRHAGCSREEVLEVLRRNGAELVAYVSGLPDAALDRSGHLALVGGELTAQQLIEAVILKSGGEHLAHMRAACGH